MLLLARRVGALVLAVGAIAVWFGLEPEESSTGTADYSSEIADAMDRYEMNNAMADSAPQQEVVNGWVTKDLLEVIATAENASLSPETAPRDDRVAAELLLVVLGLALIALTAQGGPTTRGADAAASAPVAPSGTGAAEPDTA
ncbi:hypothetical protein [Nocardioides caldifontis]|uniref:hypothetical protein n=1 Tax=Nocardioides caldifontis TaxID=2588938 RepID=UPI0011E05101|nr:hypothetical protein [Nocardioides caldifontis]